MIFESWSDAATYISGIRGVVRTIGRYNGRIIGISLNIIVFREDEGISKN